MQTSYFMRMQLDTLKHRLYQYKGRTNYFKDITKERIEEIKTLVKDFKENLPKLSINSFISEELYLYKATLNYLTNQSGKTLLPSFDEKMTFFILTIDPEFKITEKFIKSPMLTPFEKTKLTDEEIKKDEQHQEASLRFRAQILNEFGFTDLIFIAFERYYYAKFIQQTKLLNNVKANYKKELLNLMITVRNFNNITDEQYNTLNQIAKNYLAIQEDNKNPNTVAFNLLKQNKLVGNSNIIKEIIILFILIYDPELELLKIYYEESRWDKIEQRAIETLGFFHQDLIRIEELYHQKFIPDKIISIWQI